MQIKSLLAFFLTLVLSVGPAFAQANVGMYTLPLNSDIGSPTTGGTWNGEGSSGSLNFYSTLNQWDRVTLPKINATATTTPAVGNDNTQGYAVGSEWFDNVGKQIYVCSDASTGAAVWSQFSNITGGGGGISGSIAANQVAVGSGVNTISGSSALAFNGTVLSAPSISLPGATSGSFTLTPAATAGTVTVVPPTASPLSTQIAVGQVGNALQFKTMNGDATNDANLAITLATVNTSPGTFTFPTFTVNSKGLITSATSGSAPGTGTVTSVAMTGDNVLFATSINGSPITTNGTLALGASLLNAPALSWFGNATGSPAAWMFNTSAIPYTLGGTAATTQGGLQVNASPMTTLGDLVYEDATPKPVRLAGNTTINPAVLVSVGNGSISSAPTLSPLTSATPTIAYTLTGGNLQQDVIQANLSLGSIGGSLNLATQVTGQLPVGNGGSGQTAKCALLQPPVLQKSANYTRAATDIIVQYTTGSSNLFDFIPAASSATAGIEYTCVKVDTGGGSVTITPPSGTINGTTSYVINTPFNGATFYNDSVNYWIK